MAQKIKRHATISADVDRHTAMKADPMKIGRIQKSDKKATRAPKISTNVIIIEFDKINTVNTRLDTLIDLELLHISEKGRAKAKRTCCSASF